MSCFLYYGSEDESPRALERTESPFAAWSELWLLEGLRSRCSQPFDALASTSPCSSSIPSQRARKVKISVTVRSALTRLACDSRDPLPPFPSLQLARLAELRELNASPLRIGGRAKSSTLLPDISIL